MNVKQMSSGEDYISFIKDKIHYYKEIIQKTLKSLLEYKELKIISIQEYTSNVKILKTIFKSLQDMIEDKHKNENIINDLQNINDQLFMIFKNCGSWNIMDILYVCFGNELIEKLQHKNEAKLNFILDYVRPFQFKIFKQNKTKQLSNDSSKGELYLDDVQISQSAKVLQCFEIKKTSNFYSNIHGIRICFRDNKHNSIIIYGIVEDLMVDCMDNYIVKVKLKQFKDKLNHEEEKQKLYHQFLNTLTMKDILLYESKDILVKWNLYLHRVVLLRQKSISQIVKEFINSSLNERRNMLIDLLIDQDDIEFQYLSYLLYDLLSNDSNMIIDTKEQVLLFDNLPWCIREKFKNAMRNTIEYTNMLSNIDSTNIPLEQQICLMKADKSVKERAMMKLKEVKSKSEDSGSKARQYLEGLLKIPFGIFRKEECLRIIPQCREKYKEIVCELNDISSDISLGEYIFTDTISNVTIMNYIHHNMHELLKSIEEQMYISLKRYILSSTNKKKLNSIVKQVNKWISLDYISQEKIKLSSVQLSDLQNILIQHIDSLYVKNEDTKQEILQLNSNYHAFEVIKANHSFISSKWIHLNSHIKKNREILDNAIYGHKRAKRQIERIIGQWMNGEQNGYCFGFEGPPGVGKTSIAKKGLAACLKDKDGVTRPFSFIAIGGTSNGSLLDGHNYTYVGSTWGRIVDILMHSKCMNPIIFIDELDKVSRTEQGKEIIGILTHLVDPTQNDDFQDKYFNGISINLSKALFIFSYNDPEAIDRILLDRIHRIRFDNLSLKDKLVILKQYILPELLKSFGLSMDTVVFTEEVLTYIIDCYTYESGVRKLKEVLFEVISEINLQLFHQNEYLNLPIQPTKEDIKIKYLKDRTPIKHTAICPTSCIGRLNGLWANALGMGGIIPIESKFFPTNTPMELKLTGMQGDVMQESMNVAKTLALQLTSKEIRDTLDKEQGIHIHCPDGSTPKDGPSAGTAITTVLYSLLNKKIIKRDVAITGEINLSGMVTEIGGLKYKILGGIKAGVTTFLYPKENQHDFEKFYKEYKEQLDEHITFHEVSRIEEVFPIVFEDETE